MLKEQDPEPKVSCTGKADRIRTKMSWIHKTSWDLPGTMYGNLEFHFSDVFNFTGNLKTKHIWIFRISSSLYCYYHSKIEKSTVPVVNNWWSLINNVHSRCQTTLTYLSISRASAQPVI
jgi:hypothetical protein